MTATPEPPDEPDADEDIEHDMEEADTANGERPPEGEQS